VFACLLYVFKNKVRAYMSFLFAQNLVFQIFICGLQLRGRSPNLLTASDKALTAQTHAQIHTHAHTHTHTHTEYMCTVLMCRKKYMQMVKCAGEKVASSKLLPIYIKLLLGMCMYVCMYVHVYICVCVCMCARGCDESTPLSLFPSLFVCEHLHLHVYVCVCMYVCIYV